MKTFVPLIVILALSSCGNTDRTVVRLEEQGFLVVQPASQLPDFTVQNSRGETLRLSDLRGAVVLVNFWATWCPPCRAEIPSLQRLNNRLAGDDFMLLAVNVAEEAELVDSFAQEYGISFPVYLDQNAQVAELMGITALPTSILIDRSGRVFAVVKGVLEWDSWKMIRLLERVSRM